MTYLKAGSATLLVFSLFFSLKLQAMTDDKPYSLGIGSYALTISADDSGYEDDDFSGLLLNATYAFNDNVGARFNYYTLEHDDWSDLENDGFDILGYYGTGLLSEGFKAYIGGGVYRETWEVSGTDFDESFSGFQLNGGIGYHWPAVTIDLTLALRSTGDYEDFAEIDTSAIASALSIGFRF
ncbi:outer membrane beta-barrel protein [Thalassotalea sp. PS06]|uniref:outer membrane beta-barrel protein n=1 Tax=Thalassotalea sp. PS06 TaxID=2594005 RepID=UPI00116251A3|nr:outer membrane beta-barrel protein [Thalassotalea sp. PS06]QDP02314.1 outer membrane beta-barrel protein [Thalassotalea sp. PS06]